MLDSVIAHGGSVNNVNGTIVLKTGVGAACIVEFYVLPNGTHVDWYPGTTSVTETCA